jgi:phosphatidylserine/phosphatidylglycerophosphate/cardiolipin synthase-like enzyme
LKLRAAALALLLAASACSVAARGVERAPDAASTLADAVVGFTPQVEGAPSAEAVVLQGIAGAQRSVHVATFILTSKKIAQALVAAHQRGLDVRVVADPRLQTDRYSALTFVANQGVPVRANARYALMHHKFMVIDGRDLQTGSYNYTQAAAARNAENVLLLRNRRDVAAAYEQEWQRLWAEAEPVAPRH